MLRFRFLLIALVRLKQKEARFHSETALSNQQVKKKELPYVTDSPGDIKKHRKPRSSTTTNKIRLANQTDADGSKINDIITYVRFFNFHVPLTLCQLGGQCCAVLTQVMANSCVHFYTLPLISEERAPACFIKEFENRF